MNIKKQIFLTMIFFSLFSFFAGSAIEPWHYDEARGQLVLTYSLILKTEIPGEGLYLEHYLAHGLGFEPYYRILYSLDHLLGHSAKPLQSKFQDIEDYKIEVLRWEEHFLLEILLALLEINIILTRLCDYLPDGESFIVDIEKIELLKSFYSGRTRRWFFSELQEGHFEEKFDVLLVDMIDSFLHINRVVLVYLVALFKGVGESEREMEYLNILERFIWQERGRVEPKSFFAWLNPLRQWILKNIRSETFEKIYRHVTFQDELEIQESHYRRDRETREILKQKLLRIGEGLRIGSSAVPIIFNKMPISELEEHLQALTLLERGHKSIFD